MSRKPPEALGTHNSRLKTPQRSRAVLLLALALGAFLLFFRLGNTPGLHGDEAWAGVQAFAIWHGSRPMIGMNAYTGPFYEYLIAPVLAVFGYRVSVLRVTTVVAALCTIALFHTAVARAFGSKLAAFATLTLVSMPFFTAFGRLAGENFALNPALAVAAILLLLVRESWVTLLLAGLCLGTGIWNHAIFTAVPFAIAVTALYRRGLPLMRDRAPYIVCAGCAIALVPMTVIHLRMQWPAPSDLQSSTIASFLGNLTQRLVEWPALFMSVAHGDILFRRFTGQLTMGTPDILVLLVAGGLFAAWTDTPRGALRQLVVFGVALLTATLVISPNNADRYFLLPLYTLPPLVAATFVRLWKTPRWETAKTVTFGVFVCFQLTRTGINYFVTQAGSGGHISAFALGSQIETSNHFIRTDHLYRQLVSLNARHVDGEFFIAEPLRFYDLSERHFDMVTTEDRPDDAGVSGTAGDRDREGTYTIFYRGGLRLIRPDQFTDLEPVMADDKFIVTRPTSLTK